MSDNLSFYEHSKNESPVSIVSVPLELGSDERGLAAAPEYLFSHGLEKMLGSIGRKTAGKTTVECPREAHVASAGRMKHAHEIASVAKRTALIVESALKRGETVLSLGGDHSIAIGSIAGAAAAHDSLGVIYIDAHPDCNTEATTITGNIHGMVTSALVGHGHKLLVDISKKKVPAENFLYVGLKDFDAAEIGFLRRSSAKSFTMLDIASRGLADVFASVDELRSRVDTLWISMDMDSVDEQYAPGVGMPNQDGLTRREILALAQYIGKKCRVAGLDIVEMVPHKDVNGKTAKLALELIARFLGGEHTWYQDEYIETYRETNVTRERAPRARSARRTSKAAAQRA